MASKFCIDEDTRDSHDHYLDCEPRTRRPEPDITIAPSYIAVQDVRDLNADNDLDGVSGGRRDLGYPDRHGLVGYPDKRGLESQTESEYCSPDNSERSEFPAMLPGKLGEPISLLGLQWKYGSVLC